ncbi:hypothetical protein I4U23_011248 [Adineta vaga]|nr:hypothetical protein I4U23_011248 [Adineta vaga]
MSMTFIESYSIKHDYHTVRTMSLLLAYETLKVSQPKPHVFLVELNRPTKLNAMNQQLFDDLKTCFEQLNKEKECRVIVLTGNGRAFSTGIDITYLSNAAAESIEIDDIAQKVLHNRNMIQRIQECLRAVDKCEKPIIAAIHGFCLGAGIDLSACCDIRYSTRDTTFSIKEVDMGLAADVGTLQILPKLITDHNLFRELVYTSRKFDTNEAQQIGLISRVFDSREALLDAAISLGNVIGQKSSIAVQGSKINLNYARDHTVDDNFTFVRTWNSGMLLTEDIVNSIMATPVLQEKINLLLNCIFFIYGILSKSYDEVQIPMNDIQYIISHLQIKYRMNYNDAKNCIIELEHFFTGIKYKIINNMIDHPPGAIKNTWEIYIVHTSMYYNFSYLTFDRYIHYTPLVEDKDNMNETVWLLRSLNEQEYYSSLATWNTYFKKSKSLVNFNSNVNKFLKQFIEEYNPSLNNFKVLDIAMGQGRNSIWLAQKGYDVVGFDTSIEEVIEWIYKRLRLVKYILSNGY